MYGLVNQAVEGLVKKVAGEEAWEEIKREAGVDEEFFSSNECYDDSVTYNLVVAATKVLNLSATEVLHAFGEYWVLETARHGYGDLMTANGNTFPEFLSNLPNFHARVSLIFPDLKPPKFKVSDLAEDTLNLHYYSHREGLQDFVVGLVSGLGKMFNCDTECELVKGRRDGHDHDVFKIRWTEQVLA